MSAIHMPGAASFLTSAFICVVSNNLELAADDCECLDRAIELLTRQCRGHLCADACLSFRHDRKRKPDDINTLLEQTCGHAARQCGIAEHHRNDGMLARLQRE